MRLFQPDPRERRLMGALFFITLVVSVLLTAFFQTQIVRGEQFATRSEENRLRPVVIPAPRGNIVDRYGEIIATSIPGFSLTLLPGEEETVEATLRDLSPFLGLAESDIQRLLQQRARRPHDLLSITDDATYAQIAAIEERRSSFPNLMVVDRPKRFYPEGPAVGHLIGYVSEITREELQMPLYADAGYKQGRLIGKAGLEREYELSLAGSNGARFVEVDAMGRIVNPRTTVGILAPTPGADLETTLDIELQRYISTIFPDTMKGAVVAMVPSTGEILAMYSNPTYDPNDFVGGISTSLWTALQRDRDLPLLDRTSVGTYPPASTFKVLTAAAGIHEGLVSSETRMPIPCNGGMYYAGRYARCWYAAGHGYLNLASAIEKSCNVYFYQLGIQLGLRNLVEYGSRVGFGYKTGVDLPSELSGTFPDGIAWFERNFGRPPVPSEVMSLAIGQGPNDITMLRMAHFYAAIAGNGTAPAPHIAAGQTNNSDPEGAIDLDLDPDELAELWGGMELVTRPGGTGWLSALANFQIYGKTGTAQNPQGDDHGLFVGFSGLPGGNPEIAVAALIEHGLHGSDVAPVVAKVINNYLSRKHGIEQDPQPTLLERYESARTMWGKYDEYEAPLIPQAATAVAAQPQTQAD